jgi:intracellular sulfur oxidation DsrE/DsrF family protein
MRKIALLALASMFSLVTFSQNFNLDSTLTALKKEKDSTVLATRKAKDSIYTAGLHSDSVRIDKDFAERVRWAKIKGTAIFPAVKGNEFSGVIPVKDPTFIPDPKVEYKILVELYEGNPDSLAKEINMGLNEVARKINLHVASGVPLKKIHVVVVSHGPILNALTTNEYYKEHFKVDNPNLKLIKDLTALGVKFIACGQAMAFMDLKKEALLPVVQVSVTAQTALSYYQLIGYMKY